MERAHLTAATIGLGIGLMVSSVDWEKVKNNTEELAAVVAGLALVGGGAIAAFAEPSPNESKTRFQGDPQGSLDPSQKAK